MKNVLWENEIVEFNNIIQLNDEELRAYQKCLLEIGKDVIAFFDEEKIDYSLSGGSILGAIRHKGFIPWDDDIDLNVTRAGYNKMIKIFEKKL